MSSLFMRLGRTTLIHFGSQIAVAVSGFAATLVIARILGSETLGLYATTVALLFWATLPVNAIGSAMNKRISEGVNQSSFLAAGILLIVFISTILSLLTTVFGSWINDYVGTSVHILLVFLLLSNSGFIITNKALNGQKKVGYTGLVQAANQVIKAALQICFITLGYKFGGLVIGHIAAFLVATVLGLRAFDISPTAPRWKHFKSLYRYARYSWLGTLQTRSFAWMDTVVLAFFVSPTLIGIYEVAWNLASALALISVSISTALFPEMSELGTDNEYEKITHYVEDALVFAGIFLFPGFIGAIIVGPRILQIYSQEFQQGETILLILIVARMIAAFGGQFINTINAINRPDITFRINLYFVITNIILNILLVWVFGWYGAAIATALSAVVLLILGYYFLLILIDQLSIPWKELGYQSIAACVMGIILFFINNKISDGNYMTVFLVITGALIYMLTLISISDQIRSKGIELAL